MKRTKARRQAAPRFGEVAVALGLVCDKDVARALELQEYRRNNGQKVLMLGAMLERMGHLSSKETRRILLECPKQRGPAVPRPPTAKQRPTRRLTRGVKAVQEELSWFKKKEHRNAQSLRKQNADLLAQIKSLKVELHGLQEANARWKEELDAITEDMIAKEDLIESLRDEVAHLQGE